MYLEEKELNKVKKAISNYIDGSVNGATGEYELVQDMEENSLYGECWNKLFDKEYWELTKQDIKTMKKFMKLWEKEHMKCGGCGVNMTTKNTPTDYKFKELIDMELNEDLYYCKECDKERYPFIYEK